MLRTGAQIVVDCLLEQGVDTVFGYPGGTILNVYDALYEASDKIRHILTSHEQGAAHAADGYARATGRTGVVLATSGPGATNLVTGIATAYMDSSPLVAITCNVNLPLLGKDTFQEVDIAGITMPITKHGYIVKDITKLADTLRSAFAIAKSGRPGPVLVDITKDVTADSIEFTPLQEVQVPSRYLPSSTMDEASLDEAVSMLLAAKKPFIYVGGGAVLSDASQELARFVKMYDAPVCDTLMGQGAFDQADPHYAGMIGMHGTKAANLGVSRCDLLIALGARFSDRVTGNAARFAPDAKILHIDIDAAEIGKNVRTSHAIVGDLKAVLKELNGRLADRDIPEHAPWNEEVAELSRTYPLHYDKSVFSCPQLMEILDDMTWQDTIITTDVGQHQMWAAQFYRYRSPRTFISSGGLGTMGFGLGAAIGAKVGCPGKTVINIGGDGCFRMNMNELATASRYGIKVIEIVIDNRVLGMVRQWQTLFYGQRYSATVLDDKVDFVKVAEGLGCEAYSASTAEEFKAALEKALAAEGPVLIDCHIDRDDKVFPMVSPGASIADSFDDRDLARQDSNK